MHIRLSITGTMENHSSEEDLARKITKVLERLGEPNLKASASSLVSPRYKMYYYLQHFWAPGVEKTTPRLARMFGLHRSTVHRALNSFVDSGFLEIAITPDRSNVWVRTQEPMDGVFVSVTEWLSTQEGQAEVESWH